MDDQQRATRILVEQMLAASGLSATELARRAGLTHTTLTRFISGKVKHSLSARTIAKLVQASGVDPATATKALASGQTYFARSDYDLQGDRFAQPGDRVEGDVAKGAVTKGAVNMAAQVGEELKRATAAGDDLQAGAGGVGVDLPADRQKDIGSGHLARVWGMLNDEQRRLLALLMQQMVRANRLERVGHGEKLRPKARNS